MNITTTKYATEKQDAIVVITDGGIVKQMPFPVENFEKRSIDEWLISNTIAPYKTVEELLEDAKAAKKAAIETERDIRKFGNVTYDAIEYEADAWTITMIQQLLADARATDGASLPTTPFWRTADNSMVTLTLQDLEGLNQAIQHNVNSTYGWSWTLKAMLDAATTVAEVDAITLE